MLEVKNLTKKIDSRIILKDISFSIHTAEIALLLGENGVGKSTLLKCISGLISFKEGSINSHRKKIAISLNDKDLLIPKLTVIEYLRFVGFLHEISSKVSEERINHFLTYFSMIDEKDKLIFKLSKGNVSKLSLISCLIINSEIIILDEPFSGMDITSTEKVIEVLNQRKKEGASILLSTHNLDIIYKYSKSIFILKRDSFVSTSSNKSIDSIKQLLKG